ncbi:carbohydrate kinase family protein [Marinomonas primoryensis]|jgi:fructokinase|uniref:Carbohydrate kinase n=1 Tax=Marinomonas primoryensis TaxID=178399 RepID=A0A859D0K4_9GAMM|nr:carbohydrate kinase [Marinomonas primoryensis]QKK82423.1 carbohydrate kinase [Marinomonas primoryensis]|tara:strand:+ start:211 stop:1182 length:972 start_codon:yes stop_codon:yes gene_type:complete
MTTKVMAFGEALIDFLSNGAIQAGELESFTKFPGGAPANVAVAVARLGGNSHFVGQVGDDAFGHFLKTSLDEYGVNTSNMLMTKEAKTALAFVSLDNTGERSFEFYRSPSADILFKEADFDAAWFADSKGVFHTCSNTLTDADITKATLAGVSMARAANWIVSIDVNLRMNLWPNEQVDIQRVIDWMQSGDVVKASLEELVVLAEDPFLLIEQTLAAGVTLFVLTDGGNAIRFYTLEHGVCEVVTPKVEVKDTTAAGDAFVGGLLYQLAEKGGDRASLAVFSQQQLVDIIRFAAACGADSVTKLGAYPSLPSLEQAQAQLDRF